MSQIRTPTKQEANPSSDLYENRLQKLQNIKQQGYDPYSLYFQPKHLAHDLLELKKETFCTEKSYSLGGRLRSRRMMGKAAFCDLEDTSGRIQLYASKDSLGEDFSHFSNLDLGDIIGIEGYLFQTRTGQTTLHITKFMLLAKCLRPLPVVKESKDKIFDAFSDQEMRYRQRYVDLIVNPSVRENFIIRSQIISHIRNFLVSKDYLEVETPIMQPLAGGAAARPFLTHHNTLDMKLYLRIAPELYLKRLLVGGLPRVFEIGRNFRNEGISPKHNPEFTMLELYQAYGNIDTMLELCEELINTTVEKTKGQLEIEYGKYRINFKRPWTRLSFLESIHKYSGIDFDPKWSLAEAQKAIKQAKLNISEAEIAACQSSWDTLELLFDKKVEPELIQPTFITDYPREISPLSKSWPDNPDFTQRFEPYVAGREIGNAFSELNDPIEQKRRFQQQVESHKQESPDTAQADHNHQRQIDEDYIHALEYGMPPSGGMGIGIDRLTMLLTNSHSIRDTILFPLLRPQKNKT